MSGIVNSTGAKSGIIGTTVGTPVTDLATATFPTGHVLQTIPDYDKGTRRSTCNADGDYEDVAGLSCAITSVGLNSKFIIHAHSGMTYAVSGYMQMNIKRVITGGATTNELEGHYSGLSYYYGITHTRTTWKDTSFSYIDTPTQAIGTTITYSLRFHSDGTNEAFWVHEGGSASLMVQEIAV